MDEERKTVDFSSAWLCQQCSWNWKSSGVRPSVRLWHRLSLKLLHGFLSNFSCGFPWAICADFFFPFRKKNILILLRIFFVFVNTGPYRSENYTTQKFKSFLNFLPNGPHKTAFGIFEMLKIEIFRNFIHFRWHGTQWKWKFQNSVPPTNRNQKFQTCPAFSSQWSSQNYVGDFWILSSDF